MILQSGEEVPADGRLTEAVSLKINESTLTGEPQIDKTTDPARFDPEATNPSDHAMRGTTVIEETRHDRRSRPSATRPSSAT